MKYRNSVVVLIALIFFIIFSSISNNTDKSIEIRIDSIMSGMTLEEKIKLITGRDYWGIAAIESAGIPEINFSNGPVGVRPEIRTPLYPEGVHDSVKTTAFPVPVAMASTWNKELVEETGKAMALESRWKNIHCLLGPGVNIQRVPYGGRNFEYYSEDPFLNAEMGIAAVKGIQSEGVMSSVKHYACNNTEYERHSANVVVDDRTLHEIYLYAYGRIVKEAAPYTFMSAYNKVNGIYSAENNYLQNEVLKEKWGFKGFVMSDWGATKRTDDPANNGLDLEMPRAVNFGKELLKRVENGQFDESVIDKKVKRILWSLIHSGILDKQESFRIGKPDSKEITKKAAAEGIILLKNENNLLPLDKSSVKKIAVIGPNAIFLRTGGWGSSYICPTETVSPLEGIRSKVGNSVEIINEPGIIRRKDIFPVQNKFLYLPDKSGNGLRAHYYNNPNLDGIPLIKTEVNEIANDWGMKAPEDGLKPGAFSALYTGWIRVDDSGEYDISVSSDGGCRLYIDDKLVIDTWNKNIRELYREYASVDNEHYLDPYNGKFITRTPGILKVRESTRLEKRKFHKIRLEYQHKGSKAACVLGLQNKDFTSVIQAVEAAKQADVALIYAGISLYEEREGADLPSLYLPEGQEELIKKVAEVNPNTVVILNNGTALLLSEWIENVDAVVEAWYPGQYGGEVIADILFGDINPSGKLPMTFMKKWEDTPVFGYYPAPDIDGSHELDMNIDDAFGNEERDDLNLVYNEGIFVGYRHYDKHKIKPLFPFGHGLSYTDFKYDNIKTKTASDGLEVSFSLTNIGKHAGSEICQLYLQDLRSSLERPKKELKGFDKVFLEPGETKKVTIRVNKEELAFYHKDKKHWIIEPGRFNVMVGSSSRDLRLQDSFNW